MQSEEISTQSPTKDEEDEEEEGQDLVDTSSDAGSSVGLSRGRKLKSTTGNGGGGKVDYDAKKVNAKAILCNLFRTP